MHLKTKKKKEKITTAGSDSWLSCSSAAAHALHGSRGGPRAPPAAASGQLPARLAVPALHGSGRCPLQPQIN